MHAARRNLIGPTAPPAVVARAGLPLGLTAWVLLLLLPAGLSAEPENVGRDTRLALKARRSLLQDEDLAPLNLGVRVRQGVATLWGRVPSEKLAAKAVQQLRQVAGVSDVRSELAVVPRDADLPDLSAGPEVQKPPAPAPPPATFAGRRDAPGPVPAQPLGTGPPPLRDAVSLVSPVTPARPPPAAGPPPVVLLAPVATAAEPPADPPPADLATAVERLRAADARYRGVQAEVQGGAVFLRGRVTRTEDLMDFAAAVSRLPGVERVVLGSAEVERPR